MGKEEKVYKKNRVGCLYRREHSFPMREEFSCRNYRSSVLLSRGLWEGGEGFGRKLLSKNKPQGWVLLRW